MKKSIKIFVFSLVFVLILQACTLEGSGSVDIGNNNSNNGNTNNSGDDQVDTDTPEPPPPDATATNTDVPEDTQVPSATTVCDLVQFVSDVTVPDGTKADPGQNFTKTWRLKNAGSCTWTSDYDLVFHSGDSMGAPAAGQLTSGTVAPGGTVDVSVGLTAPTSPGTYKGFFKLRNGSGNIFGLAGNNPFWVEIKVKSPTDTPAPAAAPDLRISFIELIPSTPVQGNTVTVKVQVYNYGNAPAGAFKVVWYPGENYPSPACTWNKSGLVATGGYVLTCTYAGYPSWYSSINTMAIADSDNQVAESNESNNVELMNISVSKP